MTMFRKKPVVVTATQWFKNGDHPQDNAFEMFDYPDDQGNVFTRPKVVREGGVIRYFRDPGVPGESKCLHCDKTMHIHGWIDTLEGGHIVCPGDWVITGVKGELYPCKPDIFEASYESADAPAKPLDMLLYCPVCGVQHIDAPEPDVCECGHDKSVHHDDIPPICGYWNDGCECEGFRVAWDNPPHRKHLCKRQEGGCGFIFQPALVSTNGVAALPKPEDA